MDNYPGRLIVPDQAVGASLDYFDFFNASQTHVIEIGSVRPVVSAAVAVTGVVAVDLFLAATSAVGTGGTAATERGTSLTAATFTHTNLKQETIPAGITARLTPTGGATINQVLDFDSWFTEETNAGTYISKTFEGPITLTQNFGIKVIQGGVASVGNIGFVVKFKLLPL